MPNLPVLSEELMPNTYVALNIGASDIRLLSMKGREVGKWGNMPLAPGLVKDGLVVQPKAVAEVINALFKSVGVTKERVITGLTGLPFTYRILSLPRMKPASLHEAIQRAAKREMQLPLDDLYLSWRAIGSGRDEQYFFVLGVPRKAVDAAVQTLGEAGISPYIMDIKPLALARAANRRDAIIIDLEPECFDIVLVANGIVSIMHTVIPKGDGSFTEYNIQRLADELSKTVEFYSANHPQSPLSPSMPLLLTGELSNDTRTGELIQTATGYPVEPLAPPLKLPADLPVNLFVANIGLAMKRISLKRASKRNTDFYRDIDVNILSHQYGVKASGIKLTNVLLAITLLIGIGLSYPAYQLRSQAAAETIRLQTESNSIQQKLEQGLQAVKEAKKVESAISETTAQAERAEREKQNLLTRVGEFANTLQLVTDILPDGAHFNSVRLGGDQITVEGEADLTFTVIDYVIALENTGKFSEVYITSINESKSGGTKTTPVETSGVSFNIIFGK